MFRLALSLFRKILKNLWTFTYFFIDFVIYLKDTGFLYAIHPPT